MKAKHVAIEIMPRALWIIEGLTLFLAQRLANQSMALSLNPVILVIGLFLSLAGIILLIQTFYFLLKPMFTKELMTSGPYSYIRHPMYVAMYAILIGVGLMFFSWIWFIVLMAFIPLWYLDCRIEEGQMIDLQGEKYLRYRENTGMFCPRWRN